MKFIPRKDEIDGDEPDRNDNGLSQEQNDWLQAHGCKKLSEKEIAEMDREREVQRIEMAKPDWWQILDDANFFDGLKNIFVYFSLAVWFMAFVNYYNTDKGIILQTSIMAVNSVWGLIALGFIVNYFKEQGLLVGLVKIPVSIIGFFAGSGEPIDFEKMQAEMKEDKEKYSKEYEAKIEKARRENGYYNTVNGASKDDGKDFNTRQKEARKAAAYAKADPEFEVTYKSKGGCWVRDIVRGRDKAEVLNRYRHNPMVEVMGGVTGILE
jgi:hypothetical protein